MLTDEREISGDPSVLYSAASTTAKQAQPTHDDRLLSAALLTELDRLLSDGRLPLGLARSAVIPSRDPLPHSIY